MMRTVLALLFVVSLAAAQLAPLLHADGPNVINGSFIVILKDGLHVLDRDAHVLALKDMIVGDAESEVAHLYNIGTLIGFSARLSEKMLKAELAHPDVKYIEADQVMSLSYKQEARAPLAVTQTGATWGLGRIDQRNLPLNSQYIYNASAGAGVDVYVIDTGILTTHADFEGRATAVFNAISGESSTDLNGHGTHCAGTVGGRTYGVAKKVALKAVKVLDAEGGGSTSTVMAGVNYVTNNKNNARQNVASMSLGGGASTSIDTSVKNSISSGVVYAVAAGNDNKDACNYSPARVAVAVTVGATTDKDARASYSNWGKCLSIFAPGSSITSDWIGSNTATNTISGTSMATPHVAGVLALHLGAFPGLSPAQSKSWVVAQSTPNKVTNLPTGSGTPSNLLFSPHN